MNRLTFICKLAAGFVFCLFTVNFAQEITPDNHSKIGGLKLGEQSYGYFGTSRHVNKDSKFTTYVNYDARFALWIGAVTPFGRNPCHQRRRQ